MSKFDYESMVQRALRRVVVDSLKIAAQQGLGSTNHFYISFQTDRPDVHLSDRLRGKHPEEMTIVLQHQFWNLTIDETQFSVSLSFDGEDETLTVPLVAVTRFLDPYVKFGLEFAPEEGPQDKTRKAPTKTTPEETDSDSGSKDNVVKLDRFRKK